jgi:cation diffusion facilitator CzcD-associated flavoprotein CzcO
MSEQLQTVRIAVIGVGSAGLATLKQAVDAFNRPEVAKRVKLDLVGFETRDEVGGLW